MILDSIIGIAGTGLGCGLLTGTISVILLHRRSMVKHSAKQYNTRFMYSGNLKQTNLLDAVQFLELGRREGVLHIYVGRRKGYVTFVSGEIVDAFYRNTTGKESIFQMLELDYGDFYFESKVINQPRVISESIMDLALEWDARRYGGNGQWWPEGSTSDATEESTTSEFPPQEENANSQIPMGGYPDDVGMNNQNPYQTEHLPDDTKKNDAKKE